MKHNHNFEIDIKPMENFHEDIKKDPSDAKAATVITANNITVTGSDDLGYVDDLIIFHLIDVLQSTNDILKGKQVKINYHLTPGSLIFKPINENTVGIWVGEHNESFNPEVPKSGVPANKKEVIEEFIDISEQLLEKIECQNNDQDRVKQLQTSVKNAKQYLKEYMRDE